jgi:NADPH-dependent ferric siderophore reductase
MASPKGVLASALGRLLLRDATVTRVEEVSPRLRRLTLAGPALRGATWLPGDKVQVLLPSRDMRTYTPLGWNVDAGETELLVYQHGESPGAQWSRTVVAGEPCRFLGPQRSLRAPAGRPLVLFGDETSFAVAKALSGTGAVVAGVFEVDSRAESDAVFVRLGLGDATAVERRPGDAHLPRVVDAVQSELSRLPDAALLMTGRAHAIQALRASLKDLGRPRPYATKAYWAADKVGLD